MDTQTRTGSIVPAQPSDLIQRQEADKLMEAYSGPKHKLTGEDLLEVYKRLRKHITDPDSCNAATQAVFSMLDNEDLPRGVGRDEAVACVIEARGDITTAYELFDKCCEKIELQLRLDARRRSAYSKNELLLGADKTDEFQGKLREPNDEQVSDKDEDDDA